MESVIRWWLVRHRLRVVVHRIRFPGMPMFTQRAANELIGKRVSVAITNRSGDGDVIDREQHDCRIVRATESEGIVLQTEAGEVLTFPPDLRPYFGSRAGDLQSTWTRTLP